MKYKVGDKINYIKTGCTRRTLESGKIIKAFEFLFIKKYYVLSEGYSKDIQVVHEEDIVDLV